MGTAPKETALRFYTLVNERRLDELVELVADGYTGHGLGGGGGPEAVRQDVEGFLGAFPDMHYQVEQAIAEDDLVSVQTTFTGTHEGKFAGTPASGRSVKVAAADVFRIIDGKIQEGWSLCDSGTLFMQIGAMSVPAGRP